ncbi:MAG: ribonuclease Z [Nanoarchaeota archaeon]|nr:ribonuclease Z [Nanoarchaeota archaeon]
MKEIKLIFLGTGSSIPSKARNTPATFLEYDGNGFLFDCGEGTQRQFRYANLNPGKVDKIFISHWHGDHVLGLPGLIQTLASSGYNKKLEIYGPEGTKNFIKKMFEVFVFAENIDLEIHEVKDGVALDEKEFFIESRRMEHGPPCNAYNFVLKGQRRIDKNKLGKLKIMAGPHLQKLKEGKDALVDGKKLKFKELTYLEKGKKVSIVMDTKINAKIVPFVKEADVLIIETSFSDELKDHAEEKKHMTASQVAEIAKKAQVGKVYLTHLSPRYNNPKIILEEARKKFKNSELARDLMEVKV